MVRGLLGYGVARLLALDDRRPVTPAGIRAAQDRELARILARLGPTAVGRRFGLGDLRDAAAFRDRVAPTGYGDYAGELARSAQGEPDVLFPGRPRALAQTSGTTSSGAAGERFIPQGADLLDHHARGGRAALARLAAAVGPRLFAGRMLMLGGSTSLTANAHGVPVGDLSGIVVDRIPSWLQGFYEPGRAIALESDWERKLARIVERLAHRDVRLVSGIPSWMLVLFDRLCRARGVERLRDAWPDLAGLIHGGHAVAPTLPMLRHHLDPATRLVEVYPASEGFLAVGSRAWTPDEDGPPPLACLCAHGIWLDFLPEDGGPAVGADGLEDGRLYRILVTTPGGLLRYQIGDLVRGCGPGLLRVAGRVRCRISVFGEHVEGDHLDAAITAAGLRVAHYHVAPVLPTPAEPRGRHEWWIESPDPIDPVAVAAAIDRHLRATVLDYDAHRAGDQQLLAPTVVPVPPGTFAAALAAQGKLGGQHKVPQAWADRTVADRLAAAATLP